jgi:hypothetical protein
VKLLGPAFAVSIAASAGGVTFNRDVLPILEKKCQSCHRPGEVAPMSLLSYESSRPWAKAIKAAVLAKKMPPWSADPRYGHFVNDPTLTAEEIRVLSAWADSGAFEGIGEERAAMKWPDGWAIQPDVVVSLPRPIPVPAKGVMEVMDIPIPSGFTEDTWVTSIEIRPGADVFIVPHRKDVKYGVPQFEPKARDADGVQIEKMQREEPKRGLLGLDAIYVPGAPPDDYRIHGAAKLVPAGSDLVIQMHYTPNGTATTDQTRVGFTIAKQKPVREVVTIVPTAPRDKVRFHIPAGDANWEARAEVVFLQNAELVWFLPHMHLRGKDMTYRLIYPSGESETVLSVKYDFNWQLAYDVKTPIVVPKGTRLEAVAHYDNSANNRFNPDPSKDVWWGDQTMEEMMVPYFAVLVKPGTKHNKIVAYSN